MILPEVERELADALAKFGPSEAKRLAEACIYAASLHAGQDPRPSGESYDNHVLRVAARIVNDFGIIDPELFIAGLLHDSVEDQLEAIAGHETSDREEAYAIIAKKYSERVSQAVRGVSNVQREEPEDREERNRLYAEHVKESCDANDDSYIVKLSDFFDNAMRMQHNNTEASQVRGAEKYLPLFDYFMSSLLSDRKLPIDQKTRHGLAEKIKEQKKYALGLLG